MQAKLLPQWSKTPEHEDQRQSWIGRLSKVCTVLLAMVGIFSILQNMWKYRNSFKPTSSSDQSCSCGATSSEALARGCQFDVLAMAWLHPHCRDQELMSMLEDIGIAQNHTWTYYSFPNATLQLSAGHVSLLAGDPSKQPDKIVTTMDWHHSHCIYLLWKQARSSATGVVTEGRYAEEKHLMNCMKLVLEFVATVPKSQELLAVSQVDLYPD